MTFFVLNAPLRAMLKAVKLQRRIVRILLELVIMIIGMITKNNRMDMRMVIVKMDIRRVIMDANEKYEGIL